jgi:hypothetical protein
MMMVCLMLTAQPLISHAQTSALGNANGSISGEESVKAASLYKFLNYVDWPPAVLAPTDAPYVIGVLNADDIADELNRMTAGRSINNRVVKVRRIQSGDNVTSGIHVLFIGRAERARQAQWLRQVQTHPVLVITESDSGIAPGSMINFRLVDDRVRFEVALEPVEKAGLRLSSRMLAVALSVTKGSTQ